MFRLLDSGVMDGVLTFSTKDRVCNPQSSKEDEEVVSAAVFGYQTYYSLSFAIFTAEMNAIVLEIYCSILQNQIYDIALHFGNLRLLPITHLLFRVEMFKSLVSIIN
jgi:hypothetical protein